MFLAAKTNMTFAKITLPFLVFFGAITPAITSYKRRNRKLSNKAVTDFEIAKNSSGFSLAFLINVVFHLHQVQNP
jgi:ABC-type transport system involved in Fe-S cluster assembly fused permease/ATPase subunit